MASNNDTPQFRKKKTEGPNDNWSYDDRVRNAYGHEMANLSTRDELVKRGVKPNTPNMPFADLTNAPNKKVGSRYKKN